MIGYRIKGQDAEDSEMAQSPGKTEHEHPTSQTVIVKTVVFYFYALFTFVFSRQAQLTV